MGMLCQQMSACCVSSPPNHLTNMGVCTMAGRDAGQCASGRHGLSIQLPAMLLRVLCTHCWSSRSNPEIDDSLHEEEHATQQSLRELGHFILKSPCVHGRPAHRVAADGAGVGGGALADRGRRAGGCGALKSAPAAHLLRPSAAVTRACCSLHMQRTAHVRLPVVFSVCASGSLLSGKVIVCKFLLATSTCYTGCCKHCCNILTRAACPGHCTRAPVMPACGQVQQNCSHCKPVGLCRGQSWPLRRYTCSNMLSCKANSPVAQVTAGAYTACTATRGCPMTLKNSQRS